MAGRDVHTRDLRYFLAVAEQLSFTRAAEELFVSQPALSKQVRALERQLGVELFERDRQGVALTVPGRALVEHARSVVGAWGEARRAVGDAAAEVSATLTVGMSTSPGRGGLLPALRSRFALAYPHASIRLRHAGWDDPSAGLAEGSSDVAFVWLPLPDQERYAWTLVAEEPRLVAFADTHRFAGRAEVAFSELLDEPFLALPESAGPLRDFWLATDERGGRPVRVGGEVASNEETYESLVAGLGVVLVARGNVPLISLGGVSAVPVTGIGPCRYVLAWRRDDHRALVRGYARVCVGLREGLSAV